MSCILNVLSIDLDTGIASHIECQLEIVQLWIMFGYLCQSLAITLGLVSISPALVKVELMPENVTRRPVTALSLPESFEMQQSMTQPRCRHCRIFFLP